MCPYFFHGCICDTFLLSYFPGFCTSELYSRTPKQLKIDHNEIQGIFLIIIFNFFLENPVIDEKRVETATC